MLHILSVEWHSRILCKINSARTLSYSASSLRDFAGLVLPIKNDNSNARLVVTLYVLLQSYVDTYNIFISDVMRSARRYLNERPFTVSVFTGTSVRVYLILVYIYLIWCAVRKLIGDINNRNSRIDGPHENAIQFFAYTYKIVYCVCIWY